ncbi:protein mono-ADP-ribosyltransferase PARP14-like isoform X2 [Ruditapes philippinarum]|nr:protein mono-ADP-ribosyltransferase PARP14-like isoform X2 [Ruditapes philippinarum]XP_060604674.1 protein mono-ADP-ribosyltransferase PARP14-like isoform X2 [Ruditapes philippinarum]XP_060604682.1 protein mono-ADP-ribosyltransferase PARP14-like isoform X2 [Ruditapes philippinarum]
MEVSGKTVLKNKNLKLCNFCEDFDVTTYADGFCLECEVYTCDTCFQKHKGRRINRNHSLVNVEESNSVKITVDDAYETCQYHKGELVKFYCSKHDQVCCGDCGVLKHNECKLEFISNKAAAFENSQDSKTLMADLNKCKKQAEDSLSLVANNRQQLSKYYEKFVYDVDTFAVEAIERINMMKKEVLDQGKDVMLNDKRKMDDIQKESEDLIAAISHQISLVESRKDQPNKFFVTSLLVKPELKRTQHNIDIIRKKNAVTKYIFKRDQTLEETMQENRGIGMLLEQKETTGKRDEIEFKETDLVNKAQSKDPLPKEVQENRSEPSSNTKDVYHSESGGCYKFSNTLVKVYKGDILNIPVDCIVNAANKNLSHGGGVSAVIARAAGYSLTKEGDDYIAQHGEIPVGHAIATTAGVLHYKCVIHTVGPSWYDYKSRSHDDVQRCKDDLFHAIYNCFVIAERRGLKSIAIPAISSGIFGVPIDICVEQYASAIISYCKKS